MNEGAPAFQGETLFGPDPGSDPLGWYRAPDRGDIFASAGEDMSRLWREVASSLGQLADGDLARMQSYLDRNVEDLGLAFRLTGDERERPWPLGPMPVLIGAEEWDRLEAGLIQRAELLEHVVDDIYGEQKLINDGHLPAALASGSPNFARRMVGLRPPGGYHLRIYAVDLARGPTGEWRVLSDRTRLPTGIGYALENRLALIRSTGGLLASIGARRITEFFEALRFGIAEDCARADPRIGLLTPGRFNQSYPEQAHLARHLGFSLVEGRDLTVRDGRLYVRTVAGLKRIDGLWRWINTGDIDPMAFDQHSQIGVAGLVDACRSGQLSVANWPGAGVVESRAMSAFLPRLAKVVTGGPLMLPNAATWWCGQKAERDIALSRFDGLVFASAFRGSVPGIPEGSTRIGADMDPQAREEIMQGLARRPMDYVAQELVETSTTPSIVDGRFEPRRFTLRCFLARGPNGQWVAMPGGFARISKQGHLRTALMERDDFSADLCIVDESHGTRTVRPPDLDPPPVRRGGGQLPSQAADNLFWLGRYGERLHQTARIVRILVENSDGPVGRSALPESLTTADRLAALLRQWSAAPAAPADEDHPSPHDMAIAALTDNSLSGSIPSLIEKARQIALLLRDRLSRDSWRAVHRSLPAVDAMDSDSLIDACDAVVAQTAAITQLVSDNMGRTAAWRFYDMGIATERASMMLQAVQAIVPGSASAEDLTALLDLIDGTALYRSRYLTIPFIAPVLDMVLLDPAEPRGLAHQARRLVDHLSALPDLREDGLPEEPLRLAQMLNAKIAGMEADKLTGAVLDGLRDDLGALAATIGRRYFLQPDAPASRESGGLLA